MNKTQLIDSVAEKSGLSKVDAKKALDAFFETTAEVLKSEDGKLQIIGFGTFSTKMREERTARNPRDGKTVVVPAKKVVKFKPGSELEAGL